MQYSIHLYCQRHTYTSVHRSKIQPTAQNQSLLLYLNHQSQLSVRCRKNKRLQQLQLVSSASMTITDSTRPPFLCGLTGSIGMGKSTVSAMFSNHGVPVLSADDIVHQLYAAGGAAVAAVGAVFPSAVMDGAVDRAALSKCVVGNEAAMKQLEGMVHPLVEAERMKFVQQHLSQGTSLLIFDIPLLFETKADADLDAVIVVSAPAEQQRLRVLARPGMTEEKFEAILARQVPDAEKRERGDYVIDTSCSLHETEQQVVQLIQQLQGMTGTAAVRLLERSKVEKA